MHYFEAAFSVGCKALRVWGVLVVEAGDLRCDPGKWGLLIGMAEAGIVIEHEWVEVRSPVD